MPHDAKFTRKGKPDAGIECYWTLPSGEVIAWQAKYFLSMGASQWGQLDESVDTALEKHPKLNRYYICVPIDLPDARLAGQKSAIQKWADHVVKWQSWAVSKGMSVEFVWWGSHELLAKLASPDQAGLARFWFDSAVLDPPWFEKRLQEAVVTAGPRYTPEVNVELPIVQEFEAFGRTTAWVRRLKQLATKVSKIKRLAGYDVNKLGEKKSDVEGVLTRVDAVIALIRAVEIEPTSPVSFDQIVNQIRAAQIAIDAVTEHLSTFEELDDKQVSEKAARSYRDNPFRSSRYRLYDLERSLNEAAGVFAYTETLAGSALLLLDGNAGMGKTHLLCDIASKRQKAGLPTILLMGQQFLQTTEPWTQVLQQLDLGQWSAEEFVGAFEAVAQAADARALVMIDALNEGAGRAIWPAHMSAFLKRLSRSPWVAVAVSVRSNYESFVLPSNVVDSAARVTHYGFADHEYDASKTFFKHYGIEAPSTPLLAPEYRNPLFLKSICVGLKEAGHTRLPRGFHGISQVFRLYTSAINARLAKALDFDPKSQLVQRALKQIVAAFPTPRQQWLSRDDAVTLVDALLPGRNFQDSLYQGLRGEGLLVENIAAFGHSEGQEFVNLGYERLADHFTAVLILEKAGKEQEFIAPENRVLTGEDSQLSSGVLESLFIQAPETLKQELTDFVPSITSNWQWPGAYRQSLIWRDPKAFDDRTLHWFNASLARDLDRNDALEVVLTLASVPDHQWNADFLNRQLRNRSMPDRDVWWTIKLHQLYANERSAVHRAIDWALSLQSTDVVEPESVRLVSTTLAWMFSSSNRFLRDRATKAAVNLLSNHEYAAADLVRSFATVDDLYIRERVLGTAYGVAMRMDDPSRIQPLADSVLETVFTKGSVVPHFLLRDYARGVIERLHALSPQSDEVLKRVRPPYGSKWPRIPSKKSIDQLERSLQAEGKEQWGARRIISSVLHDDFGRYVIGTNWWSTNFLSLRMDQPLWRSYSERLEELQAQSGPESAPLWEAYDEAESQAARLSALMRFAEFRSLTGSGGELSSDSEQISRESEALLIGAKRDLLRGLTAQQGRELQSLWKSRPSLEASRPPKFDLHLMERYVIKRAYGMGWTTERFEHFDTHVIRYNGRSASKAERIGKKYQWIAYHEICALVSDNFQFRDEIGDSGVERAYQGPWQGYVRNLDPSHSLLSTRADSGSDEGWWAPQFEPDWMNEQDGAAWAENVTDFPDLSALVKKTDPDGTSWLVADLSFERDRPVPEGMDREEVEARRFWCQVRSFLVRNDDAAAFMKWAENVDFWGQWMPTVPSSHNLFLGEYLWSPAWKHSDNSYYGNDGWVTPSHGCPVSMRTTSFEYHQESSGFDCSIDSGFTLHLPDAAIVEIMGLTWTGRAADFRMPDGRVVTQDPSAFQAGPAALLLRSDMVADLEKAGLSLCWIVLGERQAYLPGPMERLGAVRISGACTMTDTGLRGFVKFRSDQHFNEDKPEKPIGERQF